MPESVDFVVGNSYKSIPSHAAKRSNRSGNLKTHDVVVFVHGVGHTFCSLLLLNGVCGHCTYFKNSPELDNSLAVTRVEGNGRMALPTAAAPLITPR